MKVNCWDYMNCGREIGGVRVKNLGHCPAMTYTAFHGTNGGFRSGRYCWYVAGSFHKDPPECSHVSKVGDCLDCDFFNLVKKEEGDSFQL